MELFAYLAADLPIVFASLMGLAVFIYVVLDGYDLGIGILFGITNNQERDKMIVCIEPFWDANETWLVLGVGILLVAFPTAHGIILSTLYMPATIMLFGLIIRGIAFDMRVKAKISYRKLWNFGFFSGSLIATLSQGYMLGSFVTGFVIKPINILFCSLCALSLVSGYILIGSSWLILKTDGLIQIKAIKWASKSLICSAIGLSCMTLGTLAINDYILHKWFRMPNIIFLSVIPIAQIILISILYRFLKLLPKHNDELCWVPFLLSVCIFCFSFNALAYSFFPYIIPNSMTIWSAASSAESLILILYGVIIVLPFIIGYTLFVHKIFWGKMK